MSISATPDDDERVDASRADGAGGLADDIADAAQAHAQKPTPIRLTDLGNAERLIERHGRDLRYVAPWKQWIAYDEKIGVWRRDDAEVRRRAHETVRALYISALDESDPKVKKAIADHALRSESHRAIENAVAVAATLDGVAILPKDLDTNVGKLVVANGVVDLRTGALGPFRREDFATKRIPIRYWPDAKSPRYLRFLDEVFCGDAELVSFVERFVGYSATGETSAHVIAIGHGDGENGKTVLTSVLTHVFGEYAVTADFSTFTATRSDGGRARPDVARLAGSRIVLAGEGKEGAELDEGMLKGLTGGDRRTARDIFERNFEFDPRFRLFLTTNHRPTIRGVDRGIWRRVKLIPFLASFPPGTREEGLADRLKREESEGILAWIVANGVRWYEDGLGSCTAVEVATATYKVEQDALSQFLDDCCELAPEAQAMGGALYKAFAEWAHVNGEEVVSNKAFAKSLRERGFVQLPKTRDGRPWKGLALIDPNSMFGDAGAAS